MAAFSEVIAAYLGNPFLGSFIPWRPPGRVPALLVEEGGPPERHGWRMDGPSPGPPDEIAAVASLLTAVSLKVAAVGMPTLEATMDARIAALIDDYCGTPPHSPWPWPWQSASGIAAGLSFIAGTLSPQSRLQTAVQEVSVRVLKKINEAALNPQPLPP